MSTSLEEEGLVEYYAEFVPEHFIKSNGKPVGRRSAQKYAARYDLPLVRIGLNTFIDVAAAAERLRAAQVVDRPPLPRRRGRPVREAPLVLDPTNAGRLRRGGV